MCSFLWRIVGDCWCITFRFEGPDSLYLQQPANPKAQKSDGLRAASSATETRHRSHSLPLPLPNAVFFGPPGTGKSLTARRLAESCGMDRSERDVRESKPAEVGFGRMDMARSL